MWFTLETIHFENSSIICSDANLKILNCSFDFTTLFLTGKDVINIFLDPDKVFNDLQWYLSDVWAQVVNLDSTFVKLHIENSYWHYHEMRISDSIVASTGSFRGKIINSTFNNQYLYFHSAGTFKFHLINSSLVGPDPPPLIPGQIRLQYSTAPVIIITNSTFRNLKFSDYAISILCQ